MGWEQGLGTWLYGYIYDVTGSYDLAIVATMVAICMIGICIWIAAPRKVRRVREKIARKP